MNVTISLNPPGIYTGARRALYGALALVLLSGLWALSGPTQAATAATIPVNDAAAVAAAFGTSADGDIVELGGDIVSTPTDAVIAVPVGRTLTLDLAGHSLTVTRTTRGEAGISVPTGATLLIVDSSSATGRLTASGANYSAGIGGGEGIASGTVTIKGGTVTATGGVYGAGIGGGFGAAGGTTTIAGGNVTATGQDFGAGIGGGEWGAGGSITVAGGTVVANGGKQSAGIGGGMGGAGATVSITAGTVTASGGEPSSGTIATAVGGADASLAFGSLSNGGSLTVPAGSGITIPAGTTVTNSGTIALVGSGVIVNNGVILGAGDITPSSSVTVHNYRLVADANGGAGSSGAQQVFAASLLDAGLALPAAPTRSGYTFAGWFDAADNGAAVTTSTPLGNGAGPSWPTTVTVYAHWSPVTGTIELAYSGASVLPLFPAGGLALFLGLILVLVSRRRDGTLDSSR